MINWNLALLLLGLMGIVPGFGRYQEAFVSKEVVFKFTKYIYFSDSEWIIEVVNAAVQTEIMSVDAAVQNGEYTESIDFNVLLQGLARGSLFTPLSTQWVILILINSFQTVISFLGTKKGKLPTP